MRARNIPILALLFILTMPVVAKQTSTESDVLQTIPPIIVSGPNAIAGCTILNTLPGSVVTGTRGFIMATCPNGVAAVLLKGVETPTFLLTTGWRQVVLMANGWPCSFNFIPDPFDTTLTLLGKNITSGMAVLFDIASGSVTNLAQGGFNYCLYYDNPPINGLQTFTIAWTP